MEDKNYYFDEYNTISWRGNLKFGIKYSRLRTTSCKPAY